MKFADLWTRHRVKIEAAAAAAILAGFGALAWADIGWKGRIDERTADLPAIKRDIHQLSADLAAADLPGFDARVRAMEDQLAALAVRLDIAAGLEVRVREIERALAAGKRFTERDGVVLRDELRKESLRIAEATAACLDRIASGQTTCRELEYAIEALRRK